MGENLRYELKTSQGLLDYEFGALGTIENLKDN